MSRKLLNCLTIVVLLFSLFGCSNTNKEEQNKHETSDDIQIEEDSTGTADKHDYLFVAECNGDIIVSGIQEDYGLSQYIEDIGNYSRDDFDYYSYSKIGVLRKGDRFFVYDEYDHGGEKWYKIGNYAWIKSDPAEENIIRIDTADIELKEVDLLFSKLPVSGIEAYPDDHYYGTFVPEDTCDFVIYENGSVLFTKKNNFADPVNVEFRSIPSAASIPNFAYVFPAGGDRKADGSERFYLTEKKITDIEYDDTERISRFVSSDNNPWGGGEIPPVLDVEYNGNIAFISTFVKSELHGDSYYYYTCRFNNEGSIIEEYNRGLLKCDVFFNY